MPDETKKPYQPLSRKKIRRQHEGIKKWSSKFFMDHYNTDNIGLYLGDTFFYVSPDKFQEEGADKEKPNSFRSVARVIGFEVAQHENKDISANFRYKIAIIINGKISVKEEFVNLSTLVKLTDKELKDLPDILAKEDNTLLLKAFCEPMGFRDIAELAQPSSPLTKKEQDLTQ